VAKFTFFFILFVSVGLQAATLNDPTKPINYKVRSPVVKQKSGAARPTLQSILGNKGDRKVIINNKLHKTGEQVNGYRIIKIKADAVLLTYQGRSYTLTLYPNQKSFIE